jgi:hypothetical protein
MKHINLDREDKRIKDFVRALSENTDGSILELAGKPVLTVVPVEKKPLDRDKLRATIRKHLGRKRASRHPARDPEKLKAAIKRRRDQSRELNKEWEAVDQEMWDKIY